MCVHVCSCKRTTVHKGLGTCVAHNSFIFATPYPIIEPFYYEYACTDIVYCPVVLTCQVCKLNTAHLNTRSNFGSVRPVYEN